MVKYILFLVPHVCFEEGVFMDGKTLMAEFDWFKKVTDKDILAAPDQLSTII